jgi:uncharacterized surface protein with fasciclin (FAS1) repeats
MEIMMKSTRNSVLVLAASLLGLSAPFAVQAQGGTEAAAAANPVVGGAEMLPTKTIVENASASADHSTLVAAIKAAGLDADLSGAGPFTVFAPTNEAFGRLAPGTVDTLMKPENKATLAKILKYHVVPGALSLEALVKQAKDAGGSTTLTTLEGSTLKLTAEENGVVMLTDPNGNPSYIAQPDVTQSNGVIHVVNGVLVPKLG